MYILDRVWPENSTFNRLVDQLLESCGLHRDPYLDYICAIWDSTSGEAAAVGGCFRSTLRCLAVRQELRGEGLVNQLVGHLLDVQMARGNDHVFLFTECRNVPLFSSLGFFEIARTADNVALLENRPTGFADYCAELKKSHIPGARAAAVVLNANPFTLGHRALVERASAENDEVHVFVVSEDISLIPHAVRVRLIREGLSDLKNIRYHENGAYMISSATFPSYFLRDRPAANRTHALLDAVIFQKIAASLEISARYVGEEPASQVTGIYNRVLLDVLPQAGIACVVEPRKTTADGQIISASTVRAAIRDGNRALLRRMTPESTWRYFLTPEARPVIEAIQQSGHVIHY